MTANNAHHDLIEKAIAARGNAYAPYSQFPVGAAILGESGKIYTGCNVENISYGLTICAERSALFQGITGGEKSFKVIALVTDTDNPVPPCGACLQVLAEFNPNMTVIMATIQGKQKTQSLKELLPVPFQKGPV